MQIISKNTNYFEFDDFQKSIVQIQHEILHVNERLTMNEIKIDDMNKVYNDLFDDNRIITDKQENKIKSVIASTDELLKIVQEVYKIANKSTRNISNSNNNSPDKSHISPEVNRVIDNNNTNLNSNRDMTKNEKGYFL